MWSSEDDLSLELNILIWNVNYDETTFIFSYTILYFKNVQLRIDIIISHQAFQNEHGGA